MNKWQTITDMEVNQGELMAHMIPLEFNTEPHILHHRKILSNSSSPTALSSSYTQLITRACNVASTKPLSQSWLNGAAFPSRMLAAGGAWRTWRL